MAIYVTILPHLIQCWHDYEANRLVVSTKFEPHGPNSKGWGYLV